MADDEQFSLCWNNFNTNLSAGFHESLVQGDLVDVTLIAEGQLVKAHRLVLSVCSPLFRKMFTSMPSNQFAHIFLHNVSYSALKDLIQFMYCGEVNVKQEALPAFISTAESLQIKGLTDSDPPAAQSPPEPSTPTTQQQQQPQPQHHQTQQLTSPRMPLRQRTSTSRSYKIESIDENIEEKTQPTQIVIQTTTTAAPPQATIVHHHPPQQQQHIQQPQIQSVSSNATVNASTMVTTTKRIAQRSSIGSGGPHIKRTKNTIDPLDSTESATTTAQQQPSHITVQTTVVTSDNSKIQQVRQPQQQQTSTETEYIDLPAIDLPTKSEPDYTEDAGEVVTGEQDTAYEDDAYGEIRYDETYFTENEDGGTTTVNATANTSGTVSASTSKAVIKQQTSFSDSSYVDATDQGNSEAQDIQQQDIQQQQQLVFIESPWATPCLVLNDYMYNCHSRKNNKEYWRCHNYSKKIHAERCRSRCVLENGKIKNITGGLHNHGPHTEKIEKMLQRSRFASMSGNRVKLCREHIPQTQFMEQQQQLLLQQHQQQQQHIPTHHNVQITTTAGTTTTMQLTTTQQEELINASSLMLIHD